MFKDESYKISSSGPKIIKIGSWVILGTVINIIAACWARFRLLVNSCWTLLGLLIDIFATGWARLRLLIERLVTKRIDVVKATWACCDGFISGLRFGPCSIGLMRNAKAAFMCRVLPTSFPICDTAFALYPSQYVET